MSDHEFLKAMKIESFPTDENWLGETRRITEDEPTEGLSLSYCQELEARLLFESDRITALYQMLRSLREEHERAQLQKTKRTDSRILKAIFRALGKLGLQV